MLYQPVLDNHVKGIWADQIWWLIQIGDIQLVFFNPETQVCSNVTLPSPDTLLSILKGTFRKSKPGGKFSELYIFFS